MDPTAYLTIAQSEQIDIVLWHRNMACRVAWPCDERGHRISEHDLPVWLRDRNLVWTCMCRTDSAIGHRDIAFTTSGDGSVEAACRGGLASCMFYLNLSEIRLWTHLNDTYKNFRAGQTREEFDRALRSGAHFVPNNAPGVEGLEAVYYGWCGYFQDTQA